MSRVRRIIRVAWPFLKAVIVRYFQHEGGVIAGYMAFAGMLAVVPFLLFAVALAGMVIGSQGSEAAVEQLFNSMPTTVALTLQPVLMDMLGGQQGGLLTISAIGALYAASNGAEAVRVALDRAYEADIPRNFIQHYMFSFVIVLLGFFVFIVLAALIIVAPLAYYLVQREIAMDLPFGTGPVRYAVSIVIFCGFLWIVHRILPSRRMSGFVIWPGIVTTVLIWISAAAGFSFYLSNIGSYTVTYGTLAGVIVTLVFFYITGMAIIFGGEVNAVVNAGRLATVVADEEVLAAIDDEDMPEPPVDDDGRAVATPPEDGPVSENDRLDAARSPAEREEARAAERLARE